MAIKADEPPEGPGGAVTNVQNVPIRHEKLEPIIWLLFVGIFLLLGILIGVEVAWKDDGQMFQVIAGLLSAFSGAFFMRIKPKDDAKTIQTQNPEVK